MCHCGGSQYSLPEPGDSHHDTLDEESLHTHPPQAAQHDEAGRHIWPKTFGEIINLASLGCNIRNISKFN